MTNKLTFEVQWFGWQGPTHEIARDEIRAIDLTDAIARACNQLRAGRGNATDAHGFFVESVTRL